MVQQLASMVVTFWIALLFVANASALATLDQQSTAEDVAFEAVHTATNAASSVAAAEVFVSRFPQSNKRVLVAGFVAQQLKTIRNPEVGITLIERARAIFTEPDELNVLQPVAFEIYAHGNRVDDAFSVADSLLSRKPFEFSILSQLAHLGAQEARQKILVHLDSCANYATRAIEIIQQQKRSAEQTDAEWLGQKARLPSVYLDIGIIKIAQGKTNEAEDYLRRATQLDQRNPNSFGLLARLLDEDYSKLRLAYDSAADAAVKAELKAKLDAALDELIETYARAAGLATGRREYLELLQQLIPDLTKHYTSRHNDTAGLQQLIEKYR